MKFQQYSQHTPTLKQWVSHSNIKSKLKPINIRKNLFKPEINIFNNPLYDGLQNQETNNEQHNFGPWIQKPPENKNTICIRPYKKNSQVLSKMIKISQKPSQSIKFSEKFDEIDNFSMKDNENILPNLKYSSLQFNSVKDMVDKPLPAPKIKHSKSNSFGISISKESEKVLKEGAIPMKLKHGNFIYNYCCTDEQDMLLSVNGFKNTLKKQAKKPILLNSPTFKQNLQLAQELKQYRKQRRLK